MFGFWNLLLIVNKEFINLDKILKLFYMLWLNCYGVFVFIFCFDMEYILCKRMYKLKYNIYWRKCMLKKWN